VLTAALPTRRLSWHYRSLDERLVAFANQEMYDGSLVTFPGTGTDAVVRLEAVDGSGVVQPGEEAIESTEAEVARVVELVLEHARTRPQESLGVIALGIKHATRLDDALRKALLEADGVGDFFDEDRPERFFVKNLERVQGDERDAIILSVGYGKTPHGRVLHRFGPLNLEGGERRLNVAITRARRRMTVVSSLLASDLDPTRLKARGAMMLRDYLAYAADGTLPGARTDRDTATTAGDAATTGGEGSTEVEAAVGGQADVPRDVTTNAATEPVAAAGGPVRAEFARRLRQSGLVVHEAFGGAGHPIDLAVEDPERPGQVLVAVETDGPEYAAMQSTRDRDRLRGEQLQRLGWEHVRVWTTDLFRDPARDVSRVHAAVQRAAARRASEEAARPRRATAGVTRVESEQPLVTTAPPLASQAPPQTPPEASAELPEGAAEGPEGAAEEAQLTFDGLDPAPEEFTPAPDEGARKRRVRGRRATSKPEQTKDDTDAGWGERDDPSAHDRWLFDQRPPHWGND
jgi:hypothetical protein